MKHIFTLLTALLLAPLATLSAALLLLPLARLHALCGAACRRLLAPVGYPVPAMETLPPTKPPTSGSVRNYARDWRSRMPAFLISGLTPTSGVLDSSDLDLRPKNGKISPMKHFLATIAIACAPLFAGAATPEKIPVSVDASLSLWTVPVTANDVPARLVLDTGAMQSVMDQKMAESLHVKLHDSIYMAGGVGGTQAMQEGKVALKVPGHGKAISFPGSLLFTQLPFPTSTESNAAPIVGILGLRELIASGAVLDYASNSIILEPSGAKFAAPATHKTIRCVRHNDLWMVQVEIGGKHGLLLIDSGAQKSIIDPDFAKKADLELRLITNAKVKGITGNEEFPQACTAKDVKAGSVSLGDMYFLSVENSFKEPDWTAPDGREIPVVGNIGVDQLQRLAVLLDCRNGILCVTKTPAKDKGVDDMANFAAVGNAIKALAAAGDEEAIRLKEETIKNKGKLRITAEKAAELIARAKALPSKPANSKDTKKPAPLHAAEAPAAKPAKAAPAKVYSPAIDALNKAFVSGSAGDIKGFLSEKFAIEGLPAELTEMMLGQAFAQAKGKATGLVVAKETKTPAGFDLRLKAADGVPYDVSVDAQGKFTALKFFSAAPAPAGGAAALGATPGAYPLPGVSLPAAASKAKISGPSHDTVAFEGLGGGLILMKASINGVKGHVIVDTGAARSVVNSELFPGLKGKPVGMQGGSGKIVQASLVSANMNVGKFTFEGIEALYQPLGHFAFGGREDLKILGILGYPELEGFELMLNYPKSTIGFLVLDEKGGRVSKTAIPDPVQTMAFTYSGHLPVLNCEAGGEKLRMGLDTGAETILLASKFRKKLEASLQQKHTAENVGPDNKPVEALVGLLPEMTVEGRKHADMLTMFTEIPNISGEGGMSLDGMLGFPFLSNHRLVSINFRKKEVTLW